MSDLERTTCPRCGYSLVGLAERCSECGLAFGHMRRYAVRRFLGRLGVAAGMVALGLACAAVPPATLPIGEFGFPATRAGCLQALICLGLGGALVLAAVVWVLIARPGFHARDAALPLTLAAFDYAFVAGLIWFAVASQRPW